MYLVYDSIGGDTYPILICSNRSDAEEMCLSLAWEEFYRRSFIDSQINLHGHKTIYTNIPTLKNSGQYNVMEVPFVG